MRLGLSKNEPKSEAERKDRDKREALRKAKQEWDGKKAQEEDMKCVLSKEIGVNKILTKVVTQHRPVLVISGCKDCKYELADDQSSLIKVFMDECENVELTIKCSLVTSHLEISHSEKIEVIVAFPTHTIQVDLSNDIVVRYRQNCFQPGFSVYHAGVNKLRVHHVTDDLVEHDYDDNEDVEDKSTPKEEKQYVTHLKDGKLFTERVRRGKGMMPLTDAELATIAGSDEIEMANSREAATKKIGGGEAFQLGEYLQAAVFYTQAMDLAPHDTDLLAVCLSNRAQCNLKLGRLDEALGDAEACIAIDAKLVKGWFRKGIALHALKRFGPAIEALSKAESMEPSNKQIREALGFAKVMLQKKMKEDADAIRGL